MSDHAKVIDATDEDRSKAANYILSLHPDIRILSLSIVVGIIGGLGTVLFRRLTDIVYTWLFVVPSLWLGETSPILIILTPTVGGLIVGAIVYYVSPEARGHGVPEIVDSVNLKNGKMRYRVPFAKIIASAITIGSTGSAGREGPIAQIGGGFGSLMADVFHLDAEESKTLVISGVSAGISAIFFAPIGGILFGIEVIRRDRKAVNVLPLIVASVVGTAIAEFFLGENVALVFPKDLHYSNHLNIPIFIILGLIMGVLSVLWIVGFYFIEELFESLKLMPILVTGLGGFLVGIIELYYPEVSGISYEPINAVFALEFGIGAVLMLALVKFLATSITLGSGGSGGVFAPTLFIGAMIGSAIGYFVTGLGFSSLSVTIFGLLGMAAMLAGTARAPLTAIIMISEMVGDFQLFIPLMFTVAAAWVISKQIYDDDIYIVKLKRRGVEFGPQEDLLEDIVVRDVMTQNIVAVSPKDRIEYVLDLMKETGHTGYPVVEDGKLKGIITEHDVDHIMDQQHIKSWIVSNHCSKEVLTVVQDCPLSMAFLKMAEKGINRYPVIDKKGSHNLVGWLTRSDVMRAYRSSKKLKAQSQFEEELFEEIIQGETLQLNEDKI